ncbi:hypothetical protein EDD25_0435 [Cryobacterium psychrophilum]|nr:hypothetical protein EDD25_0435 [Cryobacterium psychrophilum]
MRVKIRAAATEPGIGSSSQLSVIGFESVGLSKPPADAPDDQSLTNEFREIHS